METFRNVSNEGDLKGMILRVYETELDVKGGWGYGREDATRLLTLPVPKAQLQHHLAHMRAYLEMNIVRPADARYGGIDLQELDRKTDGDFEKVTYLVRAIPEAIYNAFIDEYKEGYGTEAFDLQEHFARRKAATLEREIVYWFDLSAVA